MMLLEHRVDHEDGSEEVLHLPSKYEVCPRCEGRGVHDSWEGGMTADEMYENGPEFVEDYLAGHFDRQCTECKGLRVIEVVDRARCSARDLKLYDAGEAELASLRAMEESERRFEHNAACAMSGSRDYWY